jgi:hypothetical protein
MLDETCLEHLASCDACSELQARLSGLDDLLAEAAVVPPPPDLQASLVVLARASAHATAEPAGALAHASEATAASARGWLPLGWLRAFLQARQDWVPQMAALGMAGLATWRVLDFTSQNASIVDEVPRAFELVVMSPAVRSMGDLNGSAVSLLQWSAIAAVGWAISERGPVGRYFARTRTPEREPAD